MRPVITLIRNVMDGKLDTVWKMLDTLEIFLKAEEKELRGKLLMKNIC